MTVAGPSVVTAAAAAAKVADEMRRLGQAAARWPDEPQMIHRPLVMRCERSAGVSGPRRARASISIGTGADATSGAGGKWGT